MEEEQKTCETYRYFYRHYVRRSGTKFMPLNRGHCSEPRARDKTIDTPACHRYSVRRTKKAKSEE